MGKLNSQSFSWKFGWNEYQMSTGYDNGNGVCSITDPVRILMFGLSTDDASTQLTFITPKMDTSNQNEVQNVLSIGEKQFGDFGFKLTFNYFFPQVIPAWAVHTLLQCRASLLVVLQIPYGFL